LLTIPSGARGDCLDRSITLPGSSGTIVCTGNTSGEPNTFDPGPQGCVEAFGSSVATPGPDLLYTVVMPAGTVMDVLVTPSPPWDTAIYASTSSNPAEIADSCFAGIDAAFDAGQEILSEIRNETTAERTVYVIVDSASPSGPISSGPFTIEFRYTFGPSVGDNCTGGGPLVVEWAGDSFTSEGNTCGATDDFRLTFGECASVLADSLRGRDIVFEVTVPDSTEWQASVTPQTGWDPALLVTNICSTDGACVDAVDDQRAGGTEATRPIAVRRGDGGTTTQYLILDSSVPPGVSGGCGPFEIHVTKRRLPAGSGETCADPIPVTLTGSGLVTIEGWNCGRENDVAPDGTECGTVFTPPLNGPDIMYAVTLQRDMRWSVQVQPHAAFDAGLYVSTDCFQYFQTCIAGADVWGAGKGEVIEELEGTEGQVFYVFVDSSSATPCGGYDLFFRGTPTTPVEAASWGGIKARYRPSPAP
jgi:hypothetical protein